LPLGFAILCAQAISELIKRIAFLTGHRDQPFSVEHDKTAEEELIEELAQAAEKAPAAKGAN
ncbi:MAG: C4-dicarboxylate ABC transporter substrate-binding protein, partial [Aquincola sp.]|nr:C4-dicarboxylate ABC transporter substrate-binding protein [Aquincola sp.]